MIRFMRYILICSVFFDLMNLEAAPVSGRDIAVAFSNPVKDIVDFFIHKFEKNHRQRDDNKTVTPGPSMIDVPLNTNSCTDGAVKDIYGACRIRW